jgi:hypothetical protein
MSAVARVGLQALRGRTVRGRAIVVFSLYGYFAALIAQGGHLAWGWFQVPDISPSFLDLRSVTSGWECVRKGVDVLAQNPCDPLSRPANYPRMWMWPSFLGLGQSSTLILGLLVAASFFIGALAFMGRIDRLTDALVWVVLLISPAVMLGVERGNADLVLFPLVVAALLMLRAGSPIVRVVAHGAFLFAAMLKLFPAFAFVALLRQPRRWAIAGAGLVTTGFVIYALVTLQDIRTIRQVLPHSTYFSYGSDVGVRAVTAWLAAHHASLATLVQPGTERLVRWSLVAVAVALAVVIARWWKPPSDRHDVQAFFAGVAIFAGTFLLEFNFDYRLVFLLLTVPQLLRWARTSRFAVIAGATLVLTLWLSEVLSYGYRRQQYPLPYDELLTWALFVMLLGMAGAMMLPRLADLRGGRAGLRRSPRTAGS